MAQNIQRRKGAGKSFIGNLGEVPNPGPVVGIVKNNVDPTRSGRLQVYIEEFGGHDPSDSVYWRTVQYMTPFYGATEHSGTSEGEGNYVGNRHTYGMWFTPPDVGVRVLCFFVGGDPNEGYYVGALPEPGLTHMIPAVGAATEFKETRSPYLADADQLPVTEINTENLEVLEDPEFFKSPKPIHNVFASIMMQQGIIKDPIRGPIGSHSQRESPSTAYGISTPGKPIYAGGMDERVVRSQLEKGEISPQDVKVIGRQGGHSFVMDDGNLDGLDRLVRIRSSMGHQITMSDDGQTLFMIHANGQSWVELGKEGTVDIYASNSINLRGGQVNLHADSKMNLYGGSGIDLASIKVRLDAEQAVDITSKEKITMYADSTIGVGSDGTCNIKGDKVANVEGGDKLNLVGGCVGLNSGGSANVKRPDKVAKKSLPDTVYTSSGFEATGTLETIVTRAPTHQPFRYANLGAEQNTDYGGETDTEPLDTVRGILANAEAQNPDGITVDDWITQPNARISLGSVNQDGVTGMLASLAKDVGKTVSNISAADGVGIFGLAADALEVTGYLKPGTVTRFLQEPTKILTDPFGTAKEAFASVLESEAVWTGKDGIASVTNLLGNRELQTKVQENIYLDNFSKLRNQGLLRGTENKNVISGLVQSSSKFGIDTIKNWAGGTLDAGPAQSVAKTTRNASFAVDLVDKKLNSTVKRFANPGAFAQTTRRLPIDQGMERIIDSEKIPTPNYITKNPNRKDDQA